MGEIQSEGVAIDAGIIVLPPPTTGTETTASNELIQLLAPVRHFKVSGYKTGDVATCRTFVSAILAMVEDQSSTHSFSSDFFGTSFTVMVNSFSFEYVAGEVSWIEYSLDLVEGSAV